MIPTTEPPTRMDLASYLTIRTLLFFKSLIGLTDNLIKGDPQCWTSWTLYYNFTADWKACTLAPVLTKISNSVQIFTHMHNLTGPGNLPLLTSALTSCSHQQVAVNLDKRLMLNDNTAPGRLKAGLYHEGRWSDDLAGEMIHGAGGQSPEPSGWLPDLVRASQEMSSNPWG